MMTTSELISAAGVTARQIQWWIDRGIVKCRRTGRSGWPPRLFSDDQALQVLIVRELCRKGFKPGRVKQWRIMPPKDDFLVILRTKPGGRRVVWCNVHNLIPTVERASVPCYVISINDLRDELAAAGRMFAQSSPFRRRRIAA